MQISDQRSTKITNSHVQKIAYVYLRQSSMGQVRNHRESTERQYALQELAKKLGWPVARIVVLDGDLGKSGTSTADREDFKTLVTDVSLGKAGAVLAIEASRLATGEIQRRLASTDRDLWYHRNVDHRRGWLLRSL